MKSAPSLAASALLMLYAGYGNATSVVALDDEGLVRSSPIIGVAQVLRVQTEASPGGVFTVAELRFYQALKGVRTHDVVAVQIPGGPLANGMEVRVDGAPKLRTGQLLLAFLHSHGGVLKPTAMSLGVMPIIVDADGVSRVVQRTDGLAFLSPDGSTTERRVRVHNQPLDQVLAHFRDLIDAQTPPDEPGVGSGVQR